MNNSVYGVAFRSLSTGDEKLYKEATRFYHSLGFQTVKLYDNFKNHDDSNLIVGTSKNSVKECWLESFKLSELDSQGFRVPQQEASNQLQTDGVMIKLRLVDTEPLNQTADTVVYYTVSLDEVSKIGERVDDHNVKLVDPLGNVVLVTDSHDGKELNASEFIAPKDSSVEQKITVELVDKDSKKKKIAVMTSGGDSQGMNAAVRAVVRSSIYYGCDVYAVYEGYEGLVKGGDYLRKMEWKDVRGWLSEGGTLIGTARSKEFRERWGRKQASLF